MDIKGMWQKIRGYWQGAWRGYADDVRRIDGASRVMAFAVVFLGALSGLIPVGVFVVVFRVTDALVGARAVRIQTSDLHEALVTAGAVWLLVTCIAIGQEFLSGVVARTARKTASLVFPLSFLVVLFPLMPLRTVLLAVLVAATEPWVASLRIRVFATGVCAFLGLMEVSTILGYILTRSITVGGFLLFTGCVTGFVTWFILRRVTSSTHRA